jgi:hypothetical protein
MSEAAAEPPRELRADRFHGGVRLLAMAAWLVSIALVFAVLQAVLALFVEGGVWGIGALLVLIVAAVLAQPLAYFAERQVIARWPSGRAARLAPGRLAWQDKDQSAELQLNQTINYWRWRFEVKGRRAGRIPAGHVCCAIRLVQGDNVVTLYTFLPPARASGLTAEYAFHELRRSAEPAKAALGGREAMFLAAEHERWEKGAELEPADFDALLAHLGGHVEKFAANPASGM